MAPIQTRKGGNNFRMIVTLCTMIHPWRVAHLSKICFFVHWPTKKLCKKIKIDRLILCRFVENDQAIVSQLLVLWIWDQNAGRSHNIKIYNSSFERVEQFKYLGTTLRNQNSIQEEIKSWLKSRNACYHSVQNLLSSSLLSKNLRIKIYWTIIFPIILYGCETWSLTLREECRLRVFEKRVLRRIFGP